jgi:hypothetical protein
MDNFYEKNYLSHIEAISTSASKEDLAETQFLEYNKL